MTTLSRVFSFSISLSTNTLLGQDDIFVGSRIVVSGLNLLTLIHHACIQHSKAPFLRLNQIGATCAISLALCATSNAIQWNLIITFGWETIRFLFLLLDISPCNATNFIFI